MGDERQNVRKFENRQIYTGAVFHHVKYGEYFVKNYFNSRKVGIVFKNTGYEMTTRLINVKTGSVKDAYAPTVLGVGSIGDEHIKINGVFEKEYSVWKAMLVRCYCDKYQTKYPTYSGCSVSDDFLFYPNFKQWYRQQKGFGMVGWELDKDILYKGNKVYSREACCIVPLAINSLIIKSDAARGDFPIGVHLKKIGSYGATVRKDGTQKSIGYFRTPLAAFLAYKSAKESYIKIVAEKWKGQVDHRVYLALMSYEVSYDD